MRSRGALLAVLVCVSGCATEPEPVAVEPVVALADVPQHLGAELAARGLVLVLDGGQDALERAGGGVAGIAGSAPGNPIEGLRTRIPPSSSLHARMGGDQD